MLISRLLLLISLGFLVISCNKNSSLTKDELDKAYGEFEKHKEKNDEDANLQNRNEISADKFGAIVRNSPDKVLIEKNDNSYVDTSKLVPNLVIEKSWIENTAGDYRIVTMVRPEVENEITSKLPIPKTIIFSLNKNELQEAKNLLDILSSNQFILTCGELKGFYPEVYCENLEKIELLKNP